jgi:hypothetical protein
MPPYLAEIFMAASFVTLAPLFAWLLLRSLLFQFLSPQSLLLSSPATGFTAFNPQSYLPSVLQLVGNLEWSALIPSLPDWDQ